MQLTIDIPEEQVELMDRVSEKRHASRDTLLREAVAAYLSRQYALPEDANDANASGEATDVGFGLWANRGIDSVAYVQAMRDEWER